MKPLFQPKHAGLRGGFFTGSLFFFVALFVTSVESCFAMTQGFDILLSYNDTPTTAEAAAFSFAEQTWESIITGYQLDDIFDTKVTITVNLSPIDGVGGTLGSAGPLTAKLNAANDAVSPTFLYTQTGDMTFDTADTANLQSSGLLDDVILHEMHMFWDWAPCGAVQGLVFPADKSSTLTAAVNIPARTVWRHTKMNLTNHSPHMFPLNLGVEQERPTGIGTKSMEERG